MYSTRAMRKALFEKFGHIAPTIKPAALRYFYRDLTGDHSASSNLTESEIDEQVRSVIKMEDPDVVIDLRQLNSGRKSVYDVFWSECSAFIQESVGQAVDERRHQQVTHLAAAISVPDLISQVAKRCPDNTPIPCESWVRLQFWPKNWHLRSACHYTGKLDVKYMIQSRKLRKSHEDSHYAAAIFRFLRELAVKLREYSAFACLDDKHRISVGEPNYPVAAVGRAGE